MSLLYINQRGALVNAFMPTWVDECFPTKGY